MAWEKRCADIHATTVRVLQRVMEFGANSDGAAQKMRTVTQGCLAQIQPTVQGYLMLISAKDKKPNSKIAKDRVMWKTP